LLACLIAGQARASQTETAQPFAPNFVAATRLSLANDPFYASRLLQSFDFHLTAVAASPDHKAAANYLAAQISGPLNIPMAKVAAGLGQSPMPEAQAAAMLAAGALAAPQQFNAAVSGLESLKPGLGTKLVESFRSMPTLRKFAENLRLEPSGLTYNSKGKFDSLYDAIGR